MLDYITDGPCISLYFTDTWLKYIWVCQNFRLYLKYSGILSDCNYYIDGDCWVLGYNNYVSRDQEHHISAVTLALTSVGF